MAKKFDISLIGEGDRLPDFKLPVDFTLPNGDERRITFTVKHLDADELGKVLQAEGANDITVYKELCTGWDLKDEFSDATVTRLAKLFPGCAIGLINAYMSALAGNRAKN